MKGAPVIKNILVLHASPRSEGNSRALAEMFMAGAEAAGHQIRCINIGKADIKPCIACDHCRNNANNCLYQDDMQELYPAIKGSDCVVFAAPLYFYGLPAQLKAVLDRFYAFGPDYSFLQGKDCVLLMTAADTSKNCFDGAVKNYQLALINYLGWHDKGMLLVGGVNAAGAIKDNPALAEAYRLGYNI